MKIFFKMIRFCILGSLFYHPTLCSQISLNLDNQVELLQNSSLCLENCAEPFWQSLCQLNPQAFFPLRVNRLLKNTIDQQESARKLHKDFKQSQLAYENIQKFKNPAAESQFSQLITPDFMSDLKILSDLADQGFVRTMQQFIISLEKMRKGNLDEDNYRQILKKKDEYKDRLISYYESFPERDSDDTFVNKTKYKLAKLMFVTDLRGDPGLLRKKQGLDRLRELESKGFVKAKKFHDKILEK